MGFIGKLRHKARIEEDAGTTRNAVGEHVKSFQTKAAAWCSIVQLSGTELINAQQKKPQSTHSVTTHYLPGITPAMRLKWNPTIGSTKTLNILDVENVEERNQILILICQEES